MELFGFNRIDSMEDKLSKLWDEDSEKANRESFTLATRILEKEKSVMAQYILAQCYHLGIGTEADLEKALSLYAELSESTIGDDIGFLCKYAAALEDSENVRSLLYYLKAAIQDDQWSTMRIGDLLMGELMEDLPYESRYELAMKYLHRAAAMNDDQKTKELAQDCINLERDKREVRRVKLGLEERIMKLLQEHMPS